MRRSFEDTGLVLDPADGPVNVVRFAEPVRDDDPAVVVRPTWVHWVCPAGELLARQSSKQRQRSRKALRELSAMACEVHEPIDPAVFTEWAALYTAQVRAMPYGRALATIFRGTLLDPASGHALLVWRHAGRIVCGVVVEIDLGRSALVARFFAVTDHDGEQPRAMFAALADMATARGLRHLTAGNDVNFYGAMLRPGLCATKLRLGFTAVPADLFGRAPLGTVTEKVVGLTGLEPPVLRFAYHRTRPPDAVLDDFVTDDLAFAQMADAAQTEGAARLASLAREAASAAIAAAFRRSRRPASQVR